MFGLQVVSNAIGFLASASERNHYKYLFEKQETLKSICENVVVPNIEFRGEFYLISPSQFLLFYCDILNTHAMKTSSVLRNIGYKLYLPVAYFHNDLF